MAQNKYSCIPPGDRPVALYCRVSTDEQREKESILTQVDKLQSYAVARGLSVFEIYLDDGVSGDKPMPDRPAASRLLQAVQQGHVGKVLATRYDRLGRGKPSQTLTDIENIEAHGVPVECIEQTVDTTDPNGIFMRLIHIGIARAEWLTTAKRSIDGTNRLVPTGQWMGGIVPYGYKNEGYKRTSRITPSTEPIPGVGMSEAEVVQMIYRMLCDGGTCVGIARHLMDLGIPPSFVAEGARNKRSKTTSRRWTPGRVRNMVVNTLYKGLHTYGLRSKIPGRELIDREVPALVSVETWEKAQAQLKENQLFPPGKKTRPYLLRGLIKCGLCGLNYIGTSYATASGKDKSYYTCNGKVIARGKYGREGDRCPSAAIPGDFEDVIWNNILQLVQNEELTLAEIQNAEGWQEDQRSHLQERTDRLAALLEKKATEKDAVISLFRRGIIQEADLTRQIGLMQVETDTLIKELARAKAQVTAGSENVRKLDFARKRLIELQKYVQGEVPWEVRRAVVIDIIRTITVDTLFTPATGDKSAAKEGVLKVEFWFSEPQAKGQFNTFTPADNHTDRGSWRQRA